MLDVGRCRLQRARAEDIAFADPARELLDVHPKTLR
jgi:hypothetical protein